MNPVDLHEDVPTTPPVLLHRMSVVVAAPDGLSGKLAAGFAGLGWSVASLGEPHAAPRTRDEAIAALDAAATRLGGLDAVIHAPSMSAPPNASFADTNEEHWIDGAERPIWEALVVFQAAYALLRDRGGSIVSVLPTIALTGAIGFAPLSAAAEGIRQLVKSAARAWGREGVRVNCLAVPVEEWGVTCERRVPNRYGASLPGLNSPADLAGAAALLISPLAGGVTGTTVGLDRGTVLAP